jgi:hypothetical protein
MKVRLRGGGGSEGSREVLKSESERSRPGRHNL